MYRFEWDDKKNARNIGKHGIDFADVADMFDHPMLVKWDDREDYGENSLDSYWLDTNLYERCRVC